MRSTTARSGGGALEVGANAIRQEAAALRELSDMLDENFNVLVENIANSKGKIIVAGVGKSALIGAKVSATFTSTGFPSIFLHASDALHGGLGIIAADDLLISMSKSGESAEGLKVIEYASGMGVLTAVITCAPQSSMARSSDLVLRMPLCAEVCPNGLAPTTSTTMALALGDALAVASMIKAGIDMETFRRHHPGGQLGHGLRPVREIVVPLDALPVIGPNLLISEMVLLMTEKASGCALVLSEDKRLLGFISDGDLRRHMSATLFTMTADRIMSRAPAVVPDHTLVDAALRLLHGRKINHLVVENDDKSVLGVVRLQDCLSRV